MKDLAGNEFVETRTVTNCGPLMVDAPDQVVDFGYGSQVFFGGRLLAATFNSKGAAEAYLDGLKRGRSPT